MTTNSDPSSLGVDVGVGPGTGTAEDPSSPVDLKPQKVFRKKDSPPLATVTEEGLLGSTESSCSNGEAPHSTTAGLAAKPATHTSGEGHEEQGQAQPQTMELPEGCVVEGSLVVVGLESPVRVSISGVSEESGGGPLEEEQEEVLQKAITSTPDKEPSSNLLPNPLLEHLRTSPQARESFEMDELQEDEPGTRSTSRAGSELLRTASQQSDSSGFAEDPSTDCSANYLKVQESSDSCDSETTVTSHAGDATTPLATDTPTSTFDLDTPALLETHSEEVEEEEEQERLAEKQKEELERGEEEEEEEVVLEVPGYNVHQFSRLAETKELELSVPLEARSPANQLGSATDPSSSAEKEATEAGLVAESTPGSTKDSNSGGLEEEKGESTMQQPSPEASSADGEVRGMGRLNPSDRVRTALHRAKERSVSVCDDRVGGGGDGGVQSPGSRAQELRKARLSRAPLQKSHSLPTSLLTPSRVVSSLRIQLGHGSIRHCTTPTFSYRYTADAEGAMEVCSIKEEGCSDEEEEDVEVEEEGGEEGRQASSRQSTLVINARGGPPDQVSGSGVPDMPFSRIRPYPPSMPGHLTMSTTSLYSGTPHQHHQHHDWSPLHRPLSEGGGWSSVPNLTMTPQGHHHHHHHHHPQAPSPSPLHGLQHLQHNAPPQFQFRSPYPNTTTPGTGLLGSPHASLNSSFNSALAPPTPASCLTTPSPTPLFFSPPQSAYFTPPQSAGMFQNNSNNAASASALYGQMHGMVSPYGSPFHSQQHQQHQQQQQQQQQMPQPQQYQQQQYQQQQMPQPQQQQQQPQTAQPDGRFGSPVPSYSPLVHPHSAPYSMQQYSTPPPGVLGQPYPHHPHPQYSGPPYFPFPQQMAPHPLVHTPSPQQAPSSTEMQLRRVLHEIRGTVQNLAQSSTPCPGDNTPDAFSPQRSVQSLYEELQVRKRSLAVFRTQMMDLELALMRQQSQVYQHLNQDERLEAEQLQGLRGAVRQELQELELQVEDRLLTLNEQLRTAPNPAFYRHPMAMLRGQSLDSLSNASALEPVSELLREQLYLQSELGYEGGLSRATTPLSSSGRSSGTASPSRGVSSSFSSSRPPPHTSSSSSPQRGALYRASVNLTPAAPPRPGQEASSFFAQEAEVVEGGQQMGEEEVEGGGGGSVGRCSSTSTGGEQGSQAAINPHLLEERGQDGGQGAGGGAGGGGRSVTERAVENPHLQQLIKEIKDSIADEIRQEIVSELLAAVGPRRTATPSREQQQQQQP